MDFLLYDNLNYKFPITNYMNKDLTKYLINNKIFIKYIGFLCFKLANDSYIILTTNIERNKKNGCRYIKLSTTDDLPTQKIIDYTKFNIVTNYDLVAIHNNNKIEISLNTYF